MDDLEKLPDVEGLELFLLPDDPQSWPRPYCLACLSSQQMEIRDYGYECIACGKKYDEHIKPM